MKRGERETLLEDEGTGYLISVSDLMSGLLFIFIITLMAFVLNYQQATQRKEEEVAVTKEKQTELERERKEAEERAHALEKTLDDLTNARRLRAEMLEQIRMELEALGILVEVDIEHGILHLTEQAIQFPSGLATLPTQERSKLETVGAVLTRIIPCYVNAPPPPIHCDSGKRGKLESVLIEGHTDNVPVARSRFQDNWELSAERAIFTYRTMILGMHPILSELLNKDSFPVFSVAGYGEGRPRHRHVGTVADAANRRIDLRFIMTPPVAQPALLQALEEERL